MANYSRLFKLPSKLADLDTTVTGTQLNADHTLINGGSPSLASIKDTNGNNAVVLNAVASAVNWLQVSNAATAGVPGVVAAGGDTNISMQIRAKGTGKIRLTDGASATKVAILDLSGLTTARTIAFPDADTTLIATDVAATLTTKRINPRVTSTTSATTLTPTIATADMYAYTALAANLTINAPTGTPVDGNHLTFRFKDDGTSHTLTWNAIYRAMGVTLPTATTISKTVYISARYNQAETVWDVTDVKQQP